MAQALFILSCFAPFRLLSLVLEIISRDASVRRYIDVPSDQPKLPDKISIMGCPLSRFRILRKGSFSIRETATEMSEHVTVRKNGQQKTATCFATLLQNELNSDVARFTTHIKPVLQQLLTGLNTGGKTPTSSPGLFP